jgi:hypothetical protein
MTIYGEDVLIAGNFPGPTTNKGNLVLVDGDTGRRSDGSTTRRR